MELFVNVPGGKVYANSWTPERTEGLAPIILFHDSLGCVDLWRDFPQVLSESLKRPVIAYDRLGFGRSDKRADLPSIHFIEEESDIFPHLLRAFGISKCSLFGHSVGGAMAIAWAARYVDNVTAVITESTQAFVEDVTVAGISKAAQDFKDPKMIERLRKYHGDKTEWVLSAWIDVWLSKDFSSWSLRKDLPLVQCPVMAIHGDRDEYGSRKFPEMISELAGGVSEMHLLKDCGHVPHREQQPVVLDLVRNFLA
ncbi:alpha/beta fold hydrolase [Bdellovibrio sp. KM01]|uniref:alpha/beta fold hydrolase n=1 Tax=Bdellovibrio sp. KM01 TaxID=2748865 RepID=UPI0015EAE46B|nr:alpha/beta hydrolase [Bdellovibrio sp. KM01]QLY25760.1 alpha/beta hydrolase [Bdellovibrio sp. KM01]